MRIDPEKQIHVPADDEDKIYIEKLNSRGVEYVLKQSMPVQIFKKEDADKLAKQISTKLCAILEPYYKQAKMLTPFEISYTKTID